MNRDDGMAKKLSPTIDIKIDCVPVAQPRQRHRVRDGRGRIFTRNYTPKLDPVNAYKAALQIAARQAYQGPPLEGPLFVRMKFLMPRPKRLIWKTKDMPRIPHISTPDVENMQKSTCDALNKIVWRDDSQIFDVHATKLIASGSETPGVCLAIAQCDEAGEFWHSLRTTAEAEAVPWDEFH